MVVAQRPAESEFDVAGLLGEANAADLLVLEQSRAEPVAEARNALGVGPFD